MFGKGFILREENDMIIKSVNLETVCGITSKLPDNTLPEVAFAGKIKCRKIITDQCTDEPQILRENFSTAWKDTDDQLLIILTKNFIM